MVWDQFFPPKPQFTEDHLPDQGGRVVVVTGSNSGVGFALAKILYAKNATVYIAARSLAKIEQAIATIKSEHPSSSGRLESLTIDLSDLGTVRSAAQDFMARETRLDVLVHNAGIMWSPVNAKSAQGHELQMATNCIGPHLLTRLLAPVLVKTAQDTATTKDSVRIVWLTSLIAVGTAKGGIMWDDAEKRPKILSSTQDNYMMSKVGNVFLAHEWGNELDGQGVISVSLNPGLMRTELQKEQPLIQSIMGLVCKPARFGAVSELFAAFSPQVTSDKNGSYLIPWGRFGTIPDHIRASMENTEDGGTSLAKRFWKFCEDSVQMYA